MKSKQAGFSTDELLEQLDGAKVVKDGPIIGCCTVSEGGSIYGICVVAGSIFVCDGVIVAKTADARLEATESEEVIM